MKGTQSFVYFFNEPFPNKYNITHFIHPWPLNYNGKWNRTVYSVENASKSKFRLKSNFLNFKKNKVKFALGGTANKEHIQ